MYKWERIATSLRNRMHEGEFPVGSDFPGLVPLATEYRVTMGTVRRAVREMVQEGLLTDPRQGTRVKVLRAPTTDPELSRTIRELIEMRRQLDTAIALLRQISAREETSYASRRRLPGQ
jgi:DNA-binding GntR family transcriptional regulator